MRRDVFQAIADPTRRKIFDLIAKQPMNLNAVSEQFAISRPAISKHIRILNECGLITIKQQGRDRICQPNFAQLHQAAAWLDRYSNFWNAKLDALGDFLDSEHSPTK